MKMRVDVTGFVSQPTFVSNLRGRGDISLYAILAGMSDLKPAELDAFVEQVSLRAEQVRAYDAEFAAAEQESRQYEDASDEAIRSLGVLS